MRGGGELGVKRWVLWDSVSIADSSPFLQNISHSFGCTANGLQSNKRGFRLKYAGGGELRWFLELLVTRMGTLKG